MIPNNNLHPYRKFLLDYYNKILYNLDYYNNNFPLNKFQNFYNVLFHLINDETFPSKKFSIYFYVETGAGVSPEDMISKYFKNNLDIAYSSIEKISHRNKIKLHGVIWSIMFYLATIKSLAIITVDRKYDPFIGCITFTGIYHETFIHASLHEKKFNFQFAWDNRDDLNKYIRRFGGLTETSGENESLEGTFSIMDLPMGFPYCLYEEEAQENVKNFTDKIKNMVFGISKEFAINRGEEPPDKLLIDENDPFMQFALQRNISEFYSLQRKLFQQSWVKIFKPKFVELIKKIDNTISESDLSQIDLIDLTNINYLIE